MPLQAKEGQRLPAAPEAGRGKGGFLKRFQKEHGPAGTLISDLFASRTAIEYISIVLSHLVDGTFLQQP